jgi:hypothetical protein
MMKFSLCTKCMEKREARERKRERERAERGEEEEKGIRKSIIFHITQRFVCVC